MIILIISIRISIVIVVVVVIIIVTIIVTIIVIIPIIAFGKPEGHMSYSLNSWKGVLQEVISSFVRRMLGV